MTIRVNLSSNPMNQHFTDMVIQLNGAILQSRPLTMRDINTAEFLLRLKPETLIVDSENTTMSLIERLNKAGIKYRLK